MDSGRAATVPKLGAAVTIAYASTYYLPAIVAPAASLAREPARSERVKQSSRGFGRVGRRLDSQRHSFGVE